MKLKVRHFPVYNLVTVCFDYASEILCTRYREPVQCIGLLDLLYRTAIKLQKNDSGKCSIWNKFYIKEVYWNKFNLKIVNMSCDLRCLIFCQFIWELKTENIWWSRCANYFQLSFKVKNKNVMMLHNSK